MAPTAMPSSVQHTQMQGYAGVGQANTDQETRGGRFIDQMLFNPHKGHNCASPVNDMNTDSLGSFLPGHSVR